MDITNPTEYVEIVFGKTFLNEEEIEVVIKKFVPEGIYFTVERFESNSGKTTVIVKFADKEAASEFVRNAGAYDRKGEDSIKSVCFNFENFIGFSPALCLPFTLFIHILI